MHVETFMFLQPRLHFGILVGSIIVDDQMQLRMLRCFSIDFLEKLQPLLMPMLRFDGADQATLKMIQSRE